MRDGESNSEIIFIELTRHIFNPRVWVGRIMVLMVALIAILPAMNPENQVLKMVSYAWAGSGAALGPVVLLSLVWQGVTHRGACGQDAVFMRRQRLSV